MAGTEGKKESRNTSEPSDENKVEAPPPSKSDPSEFTTLNIGIADPSSESSTAAAAKDDDKLHPVVRSAQEKELGKVVIAFAIPIAMMIVTSGKDKLAQSEMSIILILLCVGFTFIFNGILLNKTFPFFATSIETVGISLVAIAFFAIIAFFLPPQISWVPVLCIALCLLPFAIVLSNWQPPPK